MGMMNSGVFANAVINITGNITSGFRSAMRETQTQLWGLMTLSNRIGGSLIQNIGSPITAHIGMGKVAEAQQRAKLGYNLAFQNWQAQKPVRPTPPPSALALFNPQLYAQQLAQYHQDMAQFPGRMNTWKQSKPDKQAFQQQIQQAAVAQGKTLLMVASIIGLGRALVSAAHYASDFTEELNKMTQTFGQSTQTVMSAVNDMGASGIGRTRLMSGISSMGIELMGAGMGEKQSAAIATSLGKRAIDISSLYNIGQDSAIHKIQSGLAGFGRPLKELGVIINEDRVETYAFVRGLWDGKSAISELAKVTARAGLIMEETQRAAGDYAKTSLELSNQYRALGGNFSNLMESIGNTGPIAALALALNGLMVGIKAVTDYITGAYERWKRNLGAPGEMSANLKEWEASNRNNEAASRAYADEVIKENFMGKGHHASHMGIADFGKRLQEQVFNDTGKQQLDLTRKLVGLTAQQVEYLKRLGFRDVHTSAPVPF